MNSTPEQTFAAVEQMSRNFADASLAAHQAKHGNVRLFGTRAEPSRRPRVRAWVIAPDGASLLSLDNSRLFDVKVTDTGWGWCVSRDNMYLTEEGNWQPDADRVDVWTETEAMRRAERALNSLTSDGRTLADVLAEEDRILAEQP